MSASGQHLGVTPAWPTCRGSRTAKRAAAGTTCRGRCGPACPTAASTPARSSTGSTCSTRTSNSRRRYACPHRPRPALREPEELQGRERQGVRGAVQGAMFATSRSATSRTSLRRPRPTTSRPSKEAYVISRGRSRGEGHGAPTAQHGSELAAGASTPPAARGSSTSSRCTTTRATSSAQPRPLAVEVREPPQDHGRARRRRRSRSGRPSARSGGRGRELHRRLSRRSARRCTATCWRPRRIRASTTTTSTRNQGGYRASPS